MADKIYIYALREVGTTEIRYVGQTSRLAMRFNGHRKDRCGAKGEWVKSVFDRGSDIEIIILQECEDWMAFTMEARWIWACKANGHRLTNTAPAATRVNMNYERQIEIKLMTPEDKEGFRVRLIELGCTSKEAIDHANDIT